MSLRRSLSNTIRAHSPFSTRSTSSNASLKQRKRWRRESDEIGRKMDEQGWTCTAEEDGHGHLGTEETGHTQSETIVDNDSVDLNDFEIVAGPPVPILSDPVAEGEGRREMARSPSPFSASQTSEPRPKISHPQRIKPSFILSPRPFIPGVTAPTHPRRRSYIEPTPTASLSRKGSARRHSTISSRKRMTPRRMDARRNRLSWPTRALSLVRRKRFLSESRADLLGESGTVRLGFDSAILLVGGEGDVASVDEFGRIVSPKPEDVPLPDSPIASSLSLPDDEDESPLPVKAHESTSTLNSSASSSTSSLGPLPSTPHPYPYRLQRPTTILKTGRKFRPYYTRPLSSHHDELHWDFNPVASTYLFLHTVIVFAEPVLPDLNFLEGVSVPGVRREVSMGRAI